MCWVLVQVPQGFIRRKRDEHCLSTWKPEATGDSDYVLLEESHTYNKVAIYFLVDDLCSSCFRMVKPKKLKFAEKIIMWRLDMAQTMVKKMKNTVEL